MSPEDRYVFDTNVLVSAAAFPASVPGQALREAKRRGQVLLSQPTAEEIAEVLNRRKFDRYIRPQTRRRFLAALVRESLVIETNLTLQVCRDPKDDKFLELAVCGQASFLVSGDKDLLVLNPFGGIPIVTPAEFLTQLSSK
jgi:uncharacterized protein